MFQYIYINMHQYSVYVRGAVYVYIYGFVLPADLVEMNFCSKRLDIFFNGPRAPLVVKLRYCNT